MATLPQDFFTIQSMLTLTGASGATYVICNGLQKALNFNPRWLALAIAEIVTLAGALATRPTFVGAAIGVVNGFLVYCTASGANTFTGTSPVTGVSPVAGTPSVAGISSPAHNALEMKRTFFAQWL
jgi:hypothetical protein